MWNAAECSGAPQAGAEPSAAVISQLPAPLIHSRGPPSASAENKRSRAQRVLAWLQAAWHPRSFGACFCANPCSRARSFACVSSDGLWKGKAGHSEPARLPERGTLLTSEKVERGSLTHAEFSSSPKGNRGPACSSICTARPETQAGSSTSFGRFDGELAKLVGPKLARGMGLPDPRSPWSVS